MWRPEMYGDNQVSFRICDRIKTEPAQRKSYIQIAFNYNELQLADPAAKK
jgi:hypothetical protein